jgi:hypothetical protein
LGSFWGQDLLGSSARSAYPAAKLVENILSRAYFIARFWAPMGPKSETEATASNLVAFHVLPPNHTSSIQFAKYLFLSDFNYSRWTEQLLIYPIVSLREINKDIVYTFTGIGIFRFSFCFWLISL